MPSEKQIAFWDRLRLQHPTLADEFPSGTEFRALMGRDASVQISAFLKTCEERYRFRPGSRRAQIADCLNSNGGNVSRTYSELAPRLTDERFDFAFTRNPTRHEKQMGIRVRQPLPLGEQMDALKRTIEAVAENRAWNTSSGRSQDSQESSQNESQDSQDNSQDSQDQDSQENSQESSQDTGTGMTPAEYLRKIREIRRSLAEDATDPRMALDEIGMRPTENGALMYRAGIPFEAALYALTMHWSPESRMRYGIEDYDQSAFGDRETGKHAKLAYCIALAKAGVPICLIGPKGTGKSHLAQDIADAMDLSYGQCPMTAGATPSWLAGKYTMGVEAEIPELTGDTMDDFLSLLKALVNVTGSSFVSTELLHAVEHGGVFVFEEMDSADPNMLLLVNNLLANGAFHNPVSGKTIKKHPDFVPIACMNTFGMGADRRYAGRERLDAASLDRWNMGRVNLDLDENLESEIFWSIINAEVTNDA